ncbi:Hypothetical protein R9X50_00213300 [Acrodontium crateriforme]|uniref:Transmembrane protein 165 n=1 Tax=Acrodontium crateriforme TaxID=150365 RepID=A0AAQ3M3N8_9PEZI|nr:Hypothetical protein R9X50_00213300 [Acrodontium crateriforme]
MKLRRASPLLLLLLPSLALADAASDTQHVASVDRVAPNQIAQPNQAPHAAETLSQSSERDATVDPSPSAASRNYKGTEAAPVDGLDGKPHAGPFVDTSRDDEDTKGKPKSSETAKSVPTSLHKFGSSKDEIPEKNDGVMNDENRPVPGKGTTGTEGGVSERTKDRKGSTENHPTKPKEAPPLPHSEQERIDAVTGTKMKQDKDTEKGDGNEGVEYVGGLGLEKPTDLPDKPHNIPHPDPKGAKLPTGSSKEDGPPVLSKPMTTTKDAQGKSAVDEIEWHEWFHSFVLSYTMILFSEIGDKTFLVAALMAMRHPRLLVFSAALSALVAMTILSALLGHVVPTLIPKRLTTLAAAILFLVFGVRMMREGLAMPKDMGVGEEMKEVEAELEEKEHSARQGSRRRNSNVTPYALEAGRGRKSSASINLPRGEPSPPSSSEHSPARGRDRLAGLSNLIGLVLSPAWVQTFVMTFLGEWGDRSQIATIAMAAGQDYWWVTLGAVAGHACCTGVAVLGGAALAGKVSLRVVTIGGAGAFLVFGVIYLFECMTE